MAVKDNAELMTIYDDVAELQEAVASLQAQMISVQASMSALQVQTLAEGTDLDTLSVGEYLIPSATICATLLNKPTSRTATGYVSVDPCGNDGQIIMRYFICDKTSVVFYQRAYYTTGWGSWFEIDLTNSGWIDLPLASGITAYSDAQKPRYMRTNKTVFISGVITGLTDNDTVIATLPSGFRPSKKVIIPIASVGQIISKMSIETDGRVIYNRSTIEPIVAVNWHSIACSFIAV